MGGEPLKDNERVGSSNSISHILESGSEGDSILKDSASKDLVKTETRTKNRQDVPSFKPIQSALPPPEL